MPEIFTDAAGLEQVMANLIVNAVHAAGRDGYVRVEGSRHGEGWRFEVEDSGPGIPADVLPRIFEPFFTTKPEGQGTGLGLAVSLGIVQRQGGTLKAEPGGDGKGRPVRGADPAHDLRRRRPAVSPRRARARLGGGGEPAQSAGGR